MGANARDKGQRGEREIADMLNLIVSEVRSSKGYPPFETRDGLFQRNQNQTAVGGSDLSNPLSLEIEVKRQEQLSINAWWKQTLESAARTDGIPILIFKQKYKPWRVVMLGSIPLQPASASSYRTMEGVRVELSVDDFKTWFRTYYSRFLA